MPPRSNHKKKATNKKKETSTKLDSATTAKREAEEKRAAANAAIMAAAKVQGAKQKAERDATDAAFLAMFEAAEQQYEADIVGADPDDDTDDDEEDEEDAFFLGGYMRKDSDDVYRIVGDYDALFSDATAGLDHVSR